VHVSGVAPQLLQAIGEDEEEDERGKGEGQEQEDEQEEGAEESRVRPAPMASVDAAAHRLAIIWIP
jgi:hypothetical protein